MNMGVVVWAATDLRRRELAALIQSQGYVDTTVRTKHKENDMYPFYNHFDSM